MCSLHNLELDTYPVPTLDSGPAFELINGISGIFRAVNSVPPTFFGVNIPIIQHHVDFRWSILEDGHFHISTLTLVILKDTGHLNANFWLAGYSGITLSTLNTSALEKLQSPKRIAGSNSNHPTYISILFQRASCEKNHRFFTPKSAGSNSVLIVYVLYSVYLRFL